MLKLLKQIFCIHEWEKIGTSYLVQFGSTKYAEFECKKCGLKEHRDIFKTRYL